MSQINAVKIKLSASLLVLTVLGCGEVSLKTQPTLDAHYTVFTNANIITMNPEQPMASVLTLKNDKIFHIGQSVDNPISENVDVIDLQGATILPGIIDSHVHVRELGMDKIKADLVGVETAQDIVARLQARFPNPTAGTWLIGQGWDEGEFGSKGYPDRIILDMAFPNNPVALESLHGFGGFYNSRALEIADITHETPDPEGGTILRRKDGTATGVMLTLAQDLIDIHIPQPSQTQLEEAIKAGLYTMAKAGVTSVHEAGMTDQDVLAFQSLAASGELPIRVYGMLDGNNNSLMADWFEQGIQDDPADWLDIRSIKVFYDGSLGSRTALMAEPYSDKPEAANPSERVSPDAMLTLGKKANNKGFQMAVHAIGDEGNNRTLNIYDAALSAPSDHRWRIEHAQVVLPDFYKRLADMGAIASMQPSHAMGDSGWAEDRVGAERIQHAYAWQRILAANGKLIFNSDLPGEPWTPMETLYFAVTRQKLDGSPNEGWYKNQAVSVETALRAMTIDNAYAAFQEAKLGSLEKGKWADFIIIDQNPMSVSPDVIKDIKIKQTWIAGSLVASHKR